MAPTYFSIMEKACEIEMTDLQKLRPIVTKDDPLTFRARLRGGYLKFEWAANIYDSHGPNPNSEIF